MAMMFDGVKVASETGVKNEVFLYKAVVTSGLFMDKM
jgi:hypothetical protein